MAFTCVYLGLLNYIQDGKDIYWPLYYPRCVIKKTIQRIRKSSQVIQTCPIRNYATHHAVTTPTIDMDS